MAASFSSRTPMEAVHAPASLHACCAGLVCMDLRVLPRAEVLPGAVCICTPCPNKHFGGQVARTTPRACHALQTPPGQSMRQSNSKAALEARTAAQLQQRTRGMLDGRIAARHGRRQPQGRTSGRSGIALVLKICAGPLPHGTLGGRVLAGVHRRVARRRAEPARRPCLAPPLALLRRDAI